MFEGLVRAVVAFVHQYGYAAIFLYMVLETSFLLHFVPSEVVVPIAAAELVHDPLSFLLFVVDTTAGATLGSLVAYVLFGRYGERLLERYGHVIHVSERNLDRSQAIFIRYGESTVLWGRLLPFVRALISIPAGFAEMDRWRFVVYSATGAALFNTGLTYLVYTGAGATSPLAHVVSLLQTELRLDVRYVQAHVRLTVVLVGVALLVAAATWLARDWIRTHPELAKLLALHVVRLVGVFVGGAFVLGALSAPAQAFAVVTGVWNDPLFWVHLGFSEQFALFFTGVLLLFAGLFVYELGQLVEVAHVRAAVADWVARVRR